MYVYVHACRRRENLLLFAANIELLVKTRLATHAIRVFSLLYTPSKAGKSFINGIGFVIETSPLAEPERWMRQGVFRYLHSPCAKAQGESHMEDRLTARLMLAERWRLLFICTLSTHDFFHRPRDWLHQWYRYALGCNFLVLNHQARHKICR